MPLRPPRRSALALLPLLMGLLATLAPPAHAQPATSPSLAAPSAAEPLHGVYVEASGGDLLSPEGCDRLLEQLRGMHCDAVFVEMRSLADAYYRSDIVPPARSLTEDFTDPLGYLLEKNRAAQAPMQIHAVLDLLRLDHQDYPLAPSPRHLRSRHPEWAQLRRDGSEHDNSGYLYLDPARPELQRHLARVVDELLRRYPLDGIVFAGLRYPGDRLDWGYNPLTLHDYAPGGAPPPEPRDPAWMRWRAERLTALLEACTGAARQARPAARVSVAALAQGPAPGGDGPSSRPLHQAALQDWPRWLEMGLADWLLLQNFHNHEAHPERFVEWIDFAHAKRGEAPVLVMVSGRLNTDSDIVRQLRLALSREAQGLVLHSYQRPAINVQQPERLLDYLGATIFSPDYVLPEYLREAIVASAPAPREFFGGGLQVETLPEPLRLPARPTPTPEPGLQASDAARALLGEKRIEDEADPLAEVWTGRLSPAQQQALEREEKLFGPRYLKVELIGGGHFVAAKVYGDNQVTKFRSRNHGVVFTLRNSVIHKMSLLDEAAAAETP